METAMSPGQVDFKTLYEADYLRWIETTVKKLRSRDYAKVDWENLIDNNKGFLLCSVLTSSQESLVVK